MARSTKPAAPDFPDEIRQPWDRQQGEGDKAWLCFSIYRDLPHENPPVPRSQRVVSSRVYPGKSPGKGVVKEIGGWSARWRWVERAAAYDTMLDRQKQDAFRKSLQQDTEVNIAVYRTMRSKAARALAIADADAIQAKDAARMADVAITGLRREAGLATEITGTTDADEAFAAWLTGAGVDNPEEDDFER
jgi:hypothetical protein